MIATTQSAFLADILANPDDDGIRLIYADWLEDNGDPVRAEFIRVQCNPNYYPYAGPHNVILAGSDYCHCASCRHTRRQHELLTPFTFWHWFDPSHTLPGLSGSPACHVNGNVCTLYYDSPDEPIWKYTITRGFISQVETTQQHWLQHGKALVRQQPITWVTLSDRDPEDRSARPVTYNGAAYTARWYEYPDDPGHERPEYLHTNITAPLFAGGFRGQHPKWDWWFLSKEDAIDAVSDACLIYAKGELQS